LHPSNSITKSSLEDLSKIYQGKVTNWKDLGGSDAPIVLYGRQSTSGTYTFFRDTVVKGEYSAKMLNMEGNEAIVDGVKGDVNGIGYVGVGYVRDQNKQARTDIKIIGVSKDAGGEAVSPLDKTAVKDGRYPIARAIYQYLAKLPTKGSVQEAFLRFEISEAGQALVEDAGFYSINDTHMAANQTVLEKIK
jgi:phosphate transport system substrate-binding protein